MDALTGLELEDQYVEICAHACVCRTRVLSQLVTDGPLTYSKLPYNIVICVNGLVLF